MAITGIDTIEGKQIIAAGAVSAKSAEMAYNDENGNPITGYQPSGDYLTTADSGNFAQKSDFFWEIREEDDPLLNRVSGNYIHALSADHAYTAETTINCLSAQTARMAIYDGNGAEISTHYYTTANISGFLTQDSLSNDFVAYSASAVELPNAKFKVDNSGQAYKIVETEGQLTTITGTKKEGTSISQFNKELLNRAVYSSNATGGTWEAGWFNTDISDSYNIPTNGIIDLTRIPEDVWNSSTTLEIDPYNYELIVLSSKEKIYTDVAYLTDLPDGTMNESAFSYDASDNITAYNGSAFKAGDEFPQSATEAIETVTSSSAIWNETTDTVSSNSGAWGGSALPISAGPGIKFEMVDNTLVASVDETVLFFAGNDSSGAQTGNLTESIMNFERIRVAGMDNDGHVDVKYIYPAWTKNADGFSTSDYEVMLYGANPFPPQSTVWEKWTRYSFRALTSFNLVLSYEGSYTANSVDNVTNNHKNSIREVVGINRIARGN